MGSTTCTVHSIDGKEYIPMWTKVWDGTVTDRDNTNTLSLLKKSSKYTVGIEVILASRLNGINSL